MKNFINLPTIRKFIFSLLFISIFFWGCKKDDDINNPNGSGKESFLEANQKWTSLGVYEFTNSFLTESVGVNSLYLRGDTMEMLTTVLYSERLLKFNVKKGGFILGIYPDLRQVLPSGGLGVTGLAMIYAENKVYNVMSTENYTELYTREEGHINLISSRYIAGADYHFPAIIQNKNYAVCSNKIQINGKNIPVIMGYNATTKKWDYHYDELDAFQRPSIISFVLEENNINGYTAYALTNSSWNNRNCNNFMMCKTNFNPSTLVSGAYRFDTLVSFDFKVDQLGEQPGIGDTIYTNLGTPNTMLNTTNFIYFLNYTNAAANVEFSPIEHFMCVNYYKFDKTTNRITTILNHAKVPNMGGELFKIAADGSLYYLNVNLSSIYKITANGIIDITPKFKSPQTRTTHISNFEIYGNTMYVGLSRGADNAQLILPQFELIKIELE